MDKTGTARATCIGTICKHANRGYWRKNYPGFVDFFSRLVFNELHSTKQIEDTIARAHEYNEKANHRISNVLSRFV